MGWLELEGAANARDVGGLPTSDGRTIAERALLRADNLQGLTPTDVKLLVDDLGLRTVVDLRSTREVEAEGPGPLRAVDTVRHVHLSVLPERGEMTDAAADALFTRREKALARYPADPMCALYLGYLEDRPENVVGALRTIADSPSAVLVHCAAGKDRTGVVAALSLTAVGVRREAVVADYAASGTRIEGIMARLRASPTYAPDLEKRGGGNDTHRSREETMDTFLTQVDKRYGGVLAWLDNHGFGAADTARLRAKLVAPA
ncbi:tyrosine-protein phosphatase [Amycolatopsis acidiphila]|uniref:Tyrosine-protein phosphatase n=1 Tax=Amycolatopsis acidiphila TaxID=715473 RepID=A0A557ZS22_9PSEU|nr:tyrosine-protein phosphatase [Amycolatopsis acidiphila]TVT14823.1 tyrosine-protein phosphatase [Amycolatopsis acidiphila]UIJ62079.1 tyrosine-protein phosphatase [Amycolatopsis acidiphila]GHG91765.1 protein-tyrosine-phosphatase [Amycolatopsis acidiphila]